MKEKILYIDDLDVNLALFNAQLRDLYDVRTALSTRQADEILAREEIKVVVTDQRMPGENGIDFIKRAREEYPDMVFIILTAFDDFETAREAINSGWVYRFLTKPWNLDELKLDLQNAIWKYNLARRNRELMLNLRVRNKELKILQQKLEGENTYLRSEIRTTKNFENIISEDKVFLTILNRINQIADSDAPVLVTGETGTGKELIARAIHNLSNRRNGPFIGVNCAAIPETLLESELFGHEKGAFTSAIKTRKGRFELAQEGTLFLDEIGEIPAALQPKLLRAIEESSIDRLGGQGSIKLNIRIICATNRNLKEEIEKNNFRSDLYYRINVFNVDLPPLRHRTGDIPVLVDFFIRKYNKKYKKDIRSIPNRKMQSLKAYNWPGNVRELENIIERAVIISGNNELKVELDSSFPGIGSGDAPPSDSLVDVERTHILKILERTSWKIGGQNGAAAILGLNRTTLLARMKKLEISRSTHEVSKY